MSTQEMQTEISRLRLENAALKGIKVAKAPKSIIRFFYNGLKVGKGSLQSGSWSFIKAWQCGPKAIPTQVVLYAKSYRGFSSEIHEEFTVENNSDGQTDYFEHDRVRILTTHPRFDEALTMIVKDLEKDIARCDKTGKADAAKGYRFDLVHVREVIASRKA